MPSAARWITFQMGVLLMSFYFVSTEKPGHGDHLFWCSLLGSTTLGGLLSHRGSHDISSFPSRKRKKKTPGILESCMHYPLVPSQQHLLHLTGKAHSWQQRCYHGDAESQQTVVKKGRWSHKSFHIVFKGTRPHLK